MKKKFELDRFLLSLLLEKQFSLFWVIVLTVFGLLISQMGWPERIVPMSIVVLLYIAFDIRIYSKLEKEFKVKSE